jgi:polysaccharide pyruvyl transferase WcaK-like protein
MEILLNISLNSVYCSHKTEQLIENLTKETLARLKTISETDYGSEVVSIVTYKMLTAIPEVLSLIQAIKKVADRKLAKDFETVLKDFQNAQKTAKKHWSSLPVASGSPM